MKQVIHRGVGVALGIMLTSSLVIAKEPLTVTAVKASSALERYPPEQAIDGKITDTSRWVSQKGTSHWLEMHLQKPSEVAGIHLYSGWKGASQLSNFEIEYMQDDKWVCIASSVVHSNRETALRLAFDETVLTDALRLVSKDSQVRVKEFIIWSEENGVPELAKIVTNTPKVATTPTIPEIYLNQSGFNRSKPKRFSAPTLSNGTPFTIHLVNGGPALFEGVIENNLGDFSPFRPDNAGDYVVKAGGITSVPFAIEPWRFERIVYQPAIDFMVDSRHYAGNYKRRCRGSFGWRDDHHFAFELRSLVCQYISNPAAYERMPQQITYPTPIDGIWGDLEPYANDAPDVVKLIHWAADFTVTQQLTHELLKGELAYFLYAWPVLKKWLPQQNYDAVLAFVQATWGQSTADRSYPYDKSPEHDLFALKTTLGSTKGELPPGHSIMPNLLMYSVYKRDRLPEADKYFNAAYRQAEWMIENLNWEDPLTTKGQRMSEHVTITSLAGFLQLYPDLAPRGLRKKIQDWANIMVRRSDNMWDFRKLTDDGQWTPSGSKRTMWNEPGNVVGLPASLMAALPFIDDTQIQARIHELAWSHIDNCFGRNPTGRHFSYDAPRELDGVEHGWYSYHKGGIGQLAEARFVLDGAPKHVHYPYNPQAGNYGWTEGWVNFNTAFNTSLAYMAMADTDLQLTQHGDTLTITLHAPLNFDFTKREPVELTLATDTTTRQITLDEKTPTSEFYVGSCRLSESGIKPGQTVRCHYGFGFMATHAQLHVQ